MQKCVLQIIVYFTKFKRFRIFKDFKHVNAYYVYNILQINNKLIFDSQKF